MMRIAMLLALDREADLDVAAVALHPVGARAIDLGIVAVVEVVDARVLEQAADDRADRDVLRDAANARAQRRCRAR